MPPWDLAFHCIPLAQFDAEFAKDQLEIMLREWYMHPNGQLPACEWAFADVNPPVHAWATWRVYDTERRMTGVADRSFLERVFHKLLLNFTWWVNRKDPEGLNVFQGGFLGLDNIGLIDRSAELPGGGRLEQSDSTAWMGMYSLNMLQIALELARENPVYEEVANKFFQHFLYVASAMNNVGGKGFSLWDEADEFFYDILHVPDAEPTPGGFSSPERHRGSVSRDRAGFDAEPARGGSSANRAGVDSEPARGGSSADRAGVDNEPARGGSSADRAGVDNEPGRGGSSGPRAGFAGRESVLRVRSLVGLIPLLAVETIEPDLLERLPRFRARLEWFLEKSPGAGGPGGQMAGAWPGRTPPVGAGAR